MPATHKIAIAVIGIDIGKTRFTLSVRNGALHILSCGKSGHIL